jgi:glycosyltransferase involved in cell wall biosynthesis
MRERRNGGVKILLVAPQPFYQERGTPIAVRLLAETLCGAGHEVDLLTLHEGDDIEVPGLRLLRISRPPLVRDVPIGFSWKKLVCDAWLTVKMASLVRANDYRVLHAVEESVFPAVVMTRSGRRKLVYDMASVMADQLVEKWGALRLLGPIFRAVEGWAVRRADVVLPVCEHIAVKARSYGPRGRVSVLEDVPLPGGKEGQEADDLRILFGIDCRFGLYVGNLEPYQGIDLLLEGVARAGEESPPVVIVGGDVKSVEKYRGKALELGVAKRVYFAGSRPVAQLEAYLRQADFLVSPRAKGVNTPMKIYSYLASGRPLLATAIPSHTQVLDDSCALIVPPDPQGIGAGLVKLAEEVKFGERLGAAAARLAEEKYSLDAYREKLLGAYRSLEEDS